MRENEKPVPGYLEKIPLDLYLLITASGLLGVWILLDDGYGPFGNGIGLFCILAAAVALVLAAIKTLYVRVRLGKWWQNTLIYKLGILIKRTFFDENHGLLKQLHRLSPVHRALLFVAAAALYAWVGTRYAPMYTDLAYPLLVWSGVAALAFFLIRSALQLEKILVCSETLAEGALDTKVGTAHMFWDFKCLGENLNAISGGMKLAVDQKLKSERLKTELITNVSHDIKTPLTSIINYVDLMQRDRAGEHRDEYLEVLSRQSARLKKLTEDLVELSKAATGNVTVNAERRSLNELLSQAVGEYADRLEKAQIEPVLTLPEQEPFAHLDGALFWRVLDNLFSNTCKYALPGTRFYIDMNASKGKIHLSFRNISRDRISVSADELMERFVRGDASRSSEGSGLGLNIARSLTELQNGTFDLTLDGDVFRVDITLPQMV